MTTPLAKAEAAFQAHCAKFAAAFAYLATTPPTKTTPDWPLIDNNLSLLRLTWKRLDCDDVDGAAAALERITW